MLRGDRVELRVLTPHDVETLTAIFGEPEVAAWWPAMDRRRIEAELLDPDPGTAVYGVTTGGALVGVIQAWEEDDPEYRHAGIDIAISSAHHGSGVAVDAIRTLARHLIAAGHHRLVIDPAAANHRAIACYRKLGFKPVGVMRQYERGADGTFHDGLLMDLLAADLT